MSGNTLAAHFDKFNKTEKGVMMFALNCRIDKQVEVHLGLLPFITVNDVKMSLSLLLQHGTKWRRAHEVMRKLDSLYFIPGNTVRFVRYLDDRKVAKRFGSHPERGKAIPMVASKRVTVGVRWNLGLRDKDGNQGDYEPDDSVLVRPRVVLECLGKGRWQVIVEKHYANAVDNYLMQFCV